MSVPRKFDHAEAVARRQAGETYAAIARDYEVTLQAVEHAVKRATDEVYRERSNEYSRTYQRESRHLPCTRGCGRLAWHLPGRPGVCVRCAGLDRATSVRDAELRCSKCDGWKIDGDFPHNHDKATRRGRHSVCRGCQAAARARTRERHKTPCHSCGTPRLADPRNPDSGLCRECWYARRRKAA